MSGAVRTAQPVKLAVLQLRVGCACHCELVSQKTSSCSKSETGLILTQAAISAILPEVNYVMHLPHLSAVVVIHVQNNCILRVTDKSLAFHAPGAFNDVR